MASPYNNVSTLIREAANRIRVTLDGDLPDGTVATDLTFVIAATPSAVPLLSFTGGSGLTVDGRIVDVDMTAAQSATLTATRYCGALWLPGGEEPLSAGTLNMITLAYPQP